MLLLQAPGSFLVVFFEIQYHENISTWLTFFITGVQQVILLILCFYFEIKKRKALKRIMDIQENTSLLHST